MCQLLGMNCNTPTDILFSFEGFHRRGGLTDHHADGWGIAFFENKGVRYFLDDKPSSESPIAQLVREYPIKSKNVIAHIRKATQGAINLANTHPFIREMWGQYWVFAHNGNLENFSPEKGKYYQPVGDTDSEKAFCHLLETLRSNFKEKPSDYLLFKHITQETEYIRTHGSFNFLLSNGELQFAHCSTQLHYIIREAPFAEAHLIDNDISLDFARVTTPNDRVAVVATLPLTDNETWQLIPPDQLLMFHDGSIMETTV